MTARLLMIALDGADEAMLDEGSANGSLPNLAALRKRGAVKPLTAPLYATDDALWASFHYGKSLADHGRAHYLRRLRNGRWSMAFEDELEAETFWQRLSLEGLKVAVMDAPKCAPPRAFDGVHLADWLCHGRYFPEPRSHPAGWAAEVVERFGAAPPSQCDHSRGPLNDVETADLVANLTRAAGMKHAAALDLLRGRAWDLCVVGFKEAHCAGHALWDRKADIGPVLQRIDTAIGELTAAAGPGAAITVFATTRMQANASLVHLEAEIVRRLNAQQGETWLKQKLRGAWRKAFGTQIPPPVEAAPFNENLIALRLRDPANARNISARLTEMADDRGRVVVGADMPSREAGERARGLPDLVLRLRPGAVPPAVVAPGLGRIEAEPPVLRPGNHASGGFLIAAGVSAAVLDQTATMQDFAGMARAVLL